MSNAFNSFNQPKPTGISFNQSSTNTFNQPKLTGIHFNQSSANTFNQPKPTEIPFNQSSTNTFNQQNYNFDLNQSHNQNIFGQFNAGNNTIQNQSNNGFFQPQNAFRLPTVNTHLGIKLTDSEIYQQLFSYIQNGGKNLNYMTALLTQNSPQILSFINPTTYQLLQGL